MLLLAGCPSPANTTCSGPVGEAGQPVALGVVLRGADGTTTVAADGAAAALIQPPQGGKVILAGVRTATIITIGVATIAAAIGAGGLGTFIFRGVALVNDALLLAGAIPAALLAILADFLLGQLERRVRVT